MRKHKVSYREAAEENRMTKRSLRITELPGYNTGVREKGHPKRIKPILNLAESEHFKERASGGRSNQCLSQKHGESSTADRNGLQRTAKRHSEPVATMRITVI